MKVTITISLFVFCLLVISDGYGQYNPGGKKRKELAAICPFEYHNKVISHGIGVRMGDPFGITYKIYYKRRVAVEFIGGYGFSALYSNIHRDRFDELPQFDSANYIAHQIDYAISLQGRAIMHNNFQTNSRLDWYAGLGYYARFYRVKYAFTSQDEDGRAAINSDSFEDLDLGPEVMVGFEFDYPNIPITVFAEISYVANFATLSSFNRVLGGLGVRYDF